MPIETLDQAADKWLRDNDWDYQKYGDRRADRSAYDTLMNYEISSNLEDAFIAGANWMRGQFTLMGTDGCKSCEDGRATTYVTLEGRCIECAHKRESNQGEAK